MSRNNAWFAGIALVLTMACLNACSSTPSIDEINRDPSRFAGKEITIRGRATDSMGFFGTGMYQVEDGTGSITVLSEDFGLPARGTNVVVTGQVQQGFSFGGKNYGTIFRETKARE